MKRRFILGVAFIGSLLASCDNSSNNNKSGPIVLGNPSTIVTETDSSHLRDLVADLKPSEALPQDTVAAVEDTTKKADTVAKVEKAPEQAPPAKMNGLSIPFKEVTVSISGITTKAATKAPDLQKTNGVTYLLSGGKLNGASLQVSGATVSNVSMRYQTAVSIKNNMGTLPLDNLSGTSGWKTLKGNNTYSISVPNDNQLETANINSGSLKNAINKASRQKRLNNKTKQQWLNSVKNVRSANQKPIDVSLRAVMFKIDGKDKAGKSFSKQVRIDL